MSTPSEPRRIRLGHSPDPDDAFMFYGIAAGGVDCGDLAFEQVLADIETLNAWAREGRLEITAVSLGAYAYIADRYALLPNGASLGDKYGPVLVAREPGLSLRGRRIAVPGLTTTAYLVLRMMVDTFETVVVPFDQILEVVRDGRADVGLVIHEGQLTWPDFGLHKLADLGEWWHAQEGLPLPLGVDCIRRDLGSALCQRLAGLVGRSIEYAMAHRDAAVAYAREFGRGLDAKRTDRFVQMYVNDDTIDYGERGREAVRRLLERGAEAGLLPALPSIDFVPFPEGYRHAAGVGV